MPRCEGWRRYGGAFTLGPTTWEQCPNEAVVILEVAQRGVTAKLPSCLVCWKEAISLEIEIRSVELIVEDVSPQEKSQ